MHNKLILYHFYKLVTYNLFINFGSGEENVRWIISPTLRTNDGKYQDRQFIERLTVLSELRL